MKLAPLLALIPALAAQSSLADGPGPVTKPVGISIAIDTDSVVGGKVAKIVFTKVAPESQALAAGVKEGDEIVELHGTAVRGVEASALKRQMNFIPGKTKRITFKRCDGTQYEVSLTKFASRTQ